MPLKGLRFENLEEAQAYLDHGEEQKGICDIKKLLEFAPVVLPIETQEMGFKRIIAFQVLPRRQEIDDGGSPLRQNR
jgi:hypothetical protein